MACRDTDDVAQKIGRFVPQEMKLPAHIGGNTIAEEMVADVANIKLVFLVRDENIFVIPGKKIEQ
jgi:hypothetical protein